MFYMATEIRYSTNVIRHGNHTALPVLTKRTFVHPRNTILIINTSGTANAYINFDSVQLATFFSDSSFSMDVNNLRNYWTAENNLTAVIKTVARSKH